MKRVALGELGKIISGSTPKTDRPEFWDGDIPWVTPADLSDHQGIYFRRPCTKITQKGYESCSATMLPPGSILFSSRAPIGHTALTEFPLCTNQGFKSIVPNSRLDPVFGFFALQFIKPQIVEMGRGATFAEVNKEIFEHIEIPLPDLPTQQRIAALLTRADRLRRLRRHALEMVEEAANGSYRQIFGDLFSTGPFPSVEFSSVLSSAGLRNGLSPSNEGTHDARVLTLTAITTKRFLRNEIKSAKFAIAPPEEKRVSKLDFLMCRGNGNLHMVGAGCFADQSYPELVFPDTIIAARIDPEKISPAYLQATWNHPAIRQQIEASARTTNGTFKVNQEGLEAIIIPLHPLPLQQKFTTLATRHDRLRRQHAESLRQAEHLFQTLLHQAFQDGKPE